MISSLWVVIEILQSAVYVCSTHTDIVWAVAKMRLLTIEHDDSQGYALQFDPPNATADTE